MALCVLSCSPKQKQTPEIKIAKTIPANFKRDDDSLFRRHQDTVYYGNQFFTGYCFSLYPDGDTAFVHGYFNGVEEGWQRNWYRGGRLSEERFYINGKKEGVQQGWWPDGKQKFLFTTDGNEYEGEFREWYASGLLGKYFHYEKGREQGSQRLWWDNGTVRANYVIRDGRKYGLIGLKICNNPYDSILAK